MNVLYRRSAILLCLLLLVLPGIAQVPETMNYQGSLKQVDGTPVSGAVQMTFTLYDALTGGSQLWTETQTVTVTVTNAHGTASNDHVITISDTASNAVFLPIVIKND